jgi:hypothetical protein
LAAVGRASNPSQPNTVTDARYNSRNTTTRDHGVIAELNENPARVRLVVSGSPISESAATIVKVSAPEHW